MSSLDAHGNRQRGADPGSFTYVLAVGFARVFLQQYGNAVLSNAAKCRRREFGR
ncbi:hypothetical protein [Fodinicola feengrottensis]|uniref:hypothetical protein n=1 Tax=Fodinicola feengrottensis TaxID=435914 RepID=UPI002442594E|nr:hypothetical protein [Fodinicola feengrottensis]